MSKNERSASKKAATDPDWSDQEKQLCEERYQQQQQNLKILEKPIKFSDYKTVRVWGPET